MPKLLFKQVTYTLQKLIEDIELGVIGLPDIQRPFVWPPSKVRDLFDSMYRGYPIGSLLFWENALENPATAKTIGTNRKQKAPALLIVDGQQRLTSLFAVVKGHPVLDKEFRPHRIRIAFNPLEERFEVTNAAIERAPEWVADIGTIWRASSTYGFIQEYLERLAAHRAPEPEEKHRAAQALDQLASLLDYQLNALELSPQIDEVQVAEIFVRINSKGTRLNEADFILTLMSVYWEDGRRALEAFARNAQTPPTDNRPSPFNPLWQPAPHQLLRVAVGMAFRRAALRHVYSLLRGKNLETGRFDEAARDAQFARLKEAQARVLDLQNWHEFLKVLLQAGYVQKSMVTSEMAVLYNYLLWLIGRYDYRLDYSSLRRLVARWFFATSLTARYTGSSESRMEQDLARFRTVHTAEEFRSVLEQEIEALLTRDYWEVTLPNELNTAAARSHTQSAFWAAQVVRKARALYSSLSVADLLSPHHQGKKRALERHHLFPRAYLIRTGITDNRLINQVANFALVEWHDNIAIGDRPPSEYVPEIEARFSRDELDEMYEHHALWPGWYREDFLTFLEKRRRRMAEVIRQGFTTLGYS